ncbi:kanadaptin-like [Zingiber officinale]|nr:kanadaptin-like [Zingiber officinale]
MKVPMGPPPPRNPNPTLENSNGEPPLAQHSQFSANQEGACAAESAVPESEANPSSSSETTGTGPEVKIVEKPSPSVSSSCSFGSQSDKLPVPYSIPTWSEPPGHPFLLEVLKDGIIIEQLDVSQKGAYMFGRVDLCDFVLEHPTISRFHAVLQFKKDEVLLYDLGSTHGTFVNKVQIKKKVYTAVHVGDVLRFGL